MVPQPAASAAAPVGSGTDRAVRSARPSRRRGDGPGVPGPVHRGPPGRGQDDQDRVRRGSRIPGPFRPRGGRRAAGQRGLHRGGRRGGRRRRRALAGHRLHPGAVAEPRWCGPCGPLPVPAIRWLAAGMRRGAGVDPQRRAGAPRPETVQRARVARRAPGDRLRGGPGRGADPAHGDPRAPWAHPRTWRPSRPGTPGRRTMASDMFSLGATLLFAATGHAPYQGETVMDILVRLATEPPDLSGLPPELTGIVTACLERSPRKRPTSASLLWPAGPVRRGHAGPRVGALVPARRGARPDRRVPARPPPRRSLRPIPARTSRRSPTR